MIAGCVGLRWCESRIYSLSVPKTITQLPVQLHKFIWKLIAPEEINIEITSPSLKLRQHLPEQNCNTSYSYSIISATPETEMNVGIFCPGGAIEKIQLRNNITISLKTFGKGFLNESNHQDLKMSFVPHIKGKVMFCASYPIAGSFSTFIRTHEQIEIRIQFFKVQAWSHCLDQSLSESVRWLIPAGRKDSCCRWLRGNSAAMSVIITDTEEMIGELYCWY